MRKIESFIISTSFTVFYLIIIVKIILYLIILPIKIIWGLFSFLFAPLLVKIMKTPGLRFEGSEWQTAVIFMEKNDIRLKLINLSYYGLPEYFQKIRWLFEQNNPKDQAVFMDGIRFNINETWKMPKRFRKKIRYLYRHFNSCKNHLFHDFELDRSKNWFDPNDYENIDICPLELAQYFLKHDNNLRENLPEKPHNPPIHQTAQMMFPRWRKQLVQNLHIKRVTDYWDIVFRMKFRMINTDMSDKKRQIIMNKIIACPKKQIICLLTTGHIKLIIDCLKKQGFTVKETQWLSFINIEKLELNHLSLTSLATIQTANQG